jgi:hypothetical protein
MNYFSKDGCIHMCVYLALQVWSESTCEMIDLYVKRDGEHKEKVANLFPIIKAADQMVDIMNGLSVVGKCHGLKKVGRVLDKPHDNNMVLLAPHVTTFAYWKKNAADPGEYVSATTSEDMTSMALGLICVCHVYLAEVHYARSAVLF